MRLRADIWINNKPYRLVEGRSGEMVTFTTPFAPKQVTGDYRLSDFDPYSIVSQTQFVGGMGHVMFARDTEYLWGVRVDTRGERTVLGPRRSDLATSVVNGEALAGVLGEQEVVREWFVLDATTTRIAVPFRTPTTGGGGTFQPGDLTGLALWLKADVGVFQDAAGTIPVVNNNDPVGRWSDQSGNGNHFTASGANRPLYKVGTPPTIQGDGVNDFLQGSAPVTGGTARTIFVVVQPETAGAEDVWLDLGNRNAGTGKGYSIGNVNISGMKLGIRTQNANRGWTPALANTALAIVTIVQTGSDMNTLSAYVNGAGLAVATTLNKAIDTVSPAYLFRDSTADTYSSCRLGEVIVYNRALSESERVQVEGYLGQRWGITVSNPNTGNLVIQRMACYVRAPVREVAPTGYLEMAVYTDSGGVPGVAVTNGTSSQVPFSRLVAGGGWVEAITPNLMASLAGDTPYWLVLQVTPGTDEYIEVMTAASSVGQYATYDGTWAVTANATALLQAGYLLLAPDAPISKYVEYNNVLYAAAGRRLYTITPSEVHLVNRVFANDIEDMAVMSRPNETSRLLVAYGTGLDIFDGTTWTTVAQPCERLAVHDNLFWRAARDATGVFVQGTSNFGDWATANTAGTKIYVGDNRYAVTCLFSWRGTLWAGKRDGLYAISYGDTYPASGVQGQANKVVDLSSELHENNFSSCAVWQGDLYFSVANGLARYSSANILSSHTPDISLRREVVRGRFVALHPTLTQLFAVYVCDIEQYSQVMVMTAGGWHGIATTARRGDRVRALYVDSGLFGPYPFVWFSSDLVPSYFVQPTWSLRRWTFPDVDYSQDGWLYTSWIDGNLITIAKDWVDIDVVSTCVDGTAIELYYRFDEADAWTYLGTVTATGTTRLVFPVGTVSDRIQLAFRLQRTAAETTPMLWGYALRFVPRPIPKQYITVQVVLADQIELITGRDERTSAQQWEDLLAARNASEAVPFVDTAGRAYMVHVDQMTRQRVDADELTPARRGHVYVAVIGMREA